MSKFTDQELPHWADYRRLSVRRPSYLRVSFHPPIHHTQGRGGKSTNPPAPFFPRPNCCASDTVQRKSKPAASIAARLSRLDGLALCRRHFCPVCSLLGPCTPDRAYSRRGLPERDDVGWPVLEMGRLGGRWRGYWETGNLFYLLWAAGRCQRAEVDCFCWGGVLCSSLHTPSWFLRSTWGLLLPSASRFCASPAHREQACEGLTIV